MIAGAETNSSDNWHKQTRQALRLTLRMLITAENRRYEPVRPDLLLPVDLLRYPYVILRRDPNTSEASIAELFTRYPIRNVALAGPTGYELVGPTGSHTHNLEVSDQSTETLFERWVASGARCCSDTDYAARAIRSSLAALASFDLPPNAALCLVARLILGLVAGTPIDCWRQPAMAFSETWHRAAHILVGTSESEQGQHLFHQLETGALLQLAYWLAPVDWRTMAWDLLGPVYTDGLSSGARRSHGVYFTPPSLVELVLNTAGVCDDHHEQSLILEPCAGTGAFIVRMLARMRISADKGRSKERLQRLFARLTAVEPDHSANELLLLNAAIQWAIACGDSPERMPDWRPIQADALMLYSEVDTAQQGTLPISTDLPESLNRLKDCNDFAYVIGNPPYVGESGHRELFAPYRAHNFWKRFCESKMDFLQFFVVLGLSKIQAHEGGRLCLLTSAYWLTADGATRLREFTLKHALLKQVVFVGGSRSLFDDAPGHHSAVVLLVRHADKQIRSQGQTQIVRVVTTTGETLKHQTHVVSQASLSGKPWFLQVKSEACIALNELDERSPLAVAYKAKQGVVPGAQRIGREELAVLGEDWVAEHHIRYDEGVFVLNQDELTALALPPSELQFIRPFIKNSAIQPYFISGYEPLWLIYLRHDIVKEADCPQIIRHLTKYAPLLRRKREYEIGRRDWFHIHWPREERMFTGEKIVTAQRGSRPAFAWSLSPLYAATDVYFITQDTCESVVNWPNLLALTGVLNSGLARFWFAHRTKAKGAQREFFSNALSQFPLPSKLAINQIKWEYAHEELVRCVRLLSSAAAGDDVETALLLTKVDEAVFHLYGLTPEAEQQVRKWLAYAITSA